MYIYIYRIYIYIYIFINIIYSQTGLKNGEPTRLVKGRLDAIQRGTRDAILWGLATSRSCALGHAPMLPATNEIGTPLVTPSCCITFPMEKKQLSLFGATANFRRNPVAWNIWRLPKIGLPRVPPVIIHFSRVNIKHPAIGVPMT